MPEHCESPVKKYEDKRCRDTASSYPIEVTSNTRSKRRIKLQSAKPGHRNKNYDGDESNSLLQSSQDEKQSQCISLDDVSNCSGINQDMKSHRSEDNDITKPQDEEGESTNVQKDNSNITAKQVLISPDQMAKLMGGLTLHDDSPKNLMPRHRIKDDDGDFMKQKLLKL
jgi:hypothetical protein